MDKKKNTAKATGLTPKNITVFTQEELLEAVVSFTAILDETVDMVFLANADPGFLTEARTAELESTQAMARIICETAAAQLAGSGKP